MWLHYVEAMGAPEHVSTDPRAEVRSYASPPRRNAPWLADRPGELTGPQPEGERLGTPGPDQGYALTLAKRFADRLQLNTGEELSDVLAGAAAIAMKRSGSYGRAPILRDVEAGLTVWGFLDATPDPELVDIRRAWFEEIHQSHHYSELRRVADAVRTEMLERPFDDIEVAYADNWRSVLDLDV